MNDVKTKYSPGPWEVVSNPLEHGEQDATSVYSTRKDEYYVADVYRGYVGSEDMSMEEHHANVALIAAAPDLLAALQELRYAATDKAEAMADAAIAKATNGV